MNVTLNNIQYIAGVITRLNAVVQQLGSSFPQPQIVQHGDGVAYRHAEDQRTLGLACYLKCVRMVSLANASMALLLNGFAHENYILCRSLDETTDEITFLLVISPNPQTEERKQRLLNEFYQEVYTDPTDGLTTTARDRLPRRHIHNALGVMRNRFGNAERIRRTAESISRLFSAFTHGSYTTIMELFGGRQPRYYTNGMRGTIRVAEAIEDFPRHFYRAILCVELLCIHKNRQDLKALCRQLAEKFAQQTDCVAGADEMPPYS